MTLVWSFKEDPIRACWDIQIFIFWGHLPLEVVFHWRLSSFKPIFSLVWSHKLMFKIWGGSDQWLLRNLTFHILRSPSIRGRLPLKVIFIETFFYIFWSHVLIFKIWGSSDQWLLIYLNFHIFRSSYIWGRLPLKVVFIETLFDFGLVPWAYV